MAIRCKWDRAGKSITWASDKLGTQPVTALLGDMDQEIREYAMYHGLAARGTDATAMGFDHWDGKDKPKRYATDVEKLARCRRIIAHLNDAKGWDAWSMKPLSDPLAGKSAAELEALISLAKERLAGLGIE